jgi:hypothetical protein
MEETATKPNEPRRPRRERARHKDVVFGATTERIDVLRDVDARQQREMNSTETDYTAHIEALAELVDELRRSLLKKEVE